MVLYQRQKPHSALVWVAEYSPKAIENLNFRVAYEVDSFMFDNGPSDDVNIVLGSLYAGVSYKF
ncbi:hypothetical protein [Vibrio sp. 03_296]|uniref:hypothetical protein n=1 Tax=Vibrio sp. 03_296 TaxID=2024409 RepID=UPI002D7F5B6F|nr:hypothetical protein [Vibrio sp. 03_296]